MDKNMGIVIPKPVKSYKLYLKTTFFCIFWIYMGLISHDIP